MTYKAIYKVETDRPSIRVNYYPHNGGFGITINAHDNQSAVIHACVDLTMDDDMLEEFSKALRRAKTERTKDINAGQPDKCYPMYKRVEVNVY